MFGLEHSAEGLRDFLDAGGYVLWAIAGLCLVLWTLIIERYWYLRRVHPDRVRHMLDRWRQRSDRHSWHARKIREAWVSETGLLLSSRLNVIKTLIFICPMLGLLGTVTGMIHVFDVMAFMGTGNARAMARGISMATLPTMAGIAVGLSGYYFSARLAHHARTERQRLADLLGDGD